MICILNFSLSLYIKNDIIRMKKERGKIQVFLIVKKYLANILNSSFKQK